MRMRSDALSRVFRYKHIERKFKLARSPAAVTVVASLISIHGPTEISINEDDSENGNAPQPQSPCSRCRRVGSNRNVWHIVSLLNIAPT
jgi:hypothetical protein